MKPRKRPNFKDTAWYKPLYYLSLTIWPGLGVWLFRSGALAMWDRHSPGKYDLEFGWAESLIFGVPVGLVIGLIVLLQLELCYERCRDNE